MPDISSIDLTNVEPAGDFEPIPAGWYRVIVDESEEKATKSGDGKYIQLRLTVLGPTHEGRVLFDRLNLWNPNGDAVNIAKRQLTALLAAAGKPNARQTEEIHGIPIEAKVAVRPPKGEYGASNDIKSYRAPSASQQPRPTPTPRPTAPAASVPWGGKG